MHHGASGLRTHYYPNYYANYYANYYPNFYAAFVIGPDGHNIEAVCHKRKA
ncbi:MAG: hypothetical protein RL748_1629 [Pseudomonadota bacterium]|jgi:hypothetical protein